MKLLITGSFKWKTEHVEILENEGWNVCFSEREDAQLDTDVLDADAVVCNWLFVNHSIEKFSKLKYIQLLSAGLDRVPIEYIKEQHIELYNARGVYSIPMAEYAICGVLQLLKSSKTFCENQKKHVWEKKRDLLELSDRRVCVIGTGSVGIEVGKRFSAFTDEVYGVDLFPEDRPYFKKVYPLDMLDEQLRISDVVILTLPLTEQTKNMFDDSRFSEMKMGAIFVNIARGGLVQDDSLAKALDQKLFGAVVDVFSTEPLPQNSPLWDRGNLIITPHNSFVSNRNDERMWNVIHQNLTHFALEFKG